MKLLPSSASELFLLASYAVAAIAQPKLDLNDPRFRNWSRPLAVRCACPALNSLANHGFLPRSGRRIQAKDMVRAAFEGFGVSPDTVSVILTDDLESTGSTLDLTFDLDDIQRDSWKNAHDCSLSRRDGAEDSRFAFDQASWNETLDVLKTCDGIDARCFGKARAARIKAQRQRRPSTNYDSSAAAHGATEIGMLLGVFGLAPENMRLGYIRSLFETEHIPVHLGWVPVEFAASVDQVLSLAVESLTADPAVLQNATDFKVANRDDIVKALTPPTVVPTSRIKQLIRAAGFIVPGNATTVEALKNNTAAVAPRPSDIAKGPSNTTDSKDSKPSDLVTGSGNTTEFKNSKPSDIVKGPSDIASLKDSKPSDTSGGPSNTTIVKDSKPSDNLKGPDNTMESKNSNPPDIVKGPGDPAVSKDTNASGSRNSFDDQDFSDGQGSFDGQDSFNNDQDSFDSSNSSDDRDSFDSQGSFNNDQDSFDGRDSFNNDQDSFDDRDSFNGRDSSNNNPDSFDSRGSFNGRDSFNNDPNSFDD